MKRAPATFDHPLVLVDDGEASGEDKTENEKTNDNTDMAKKAASKPESVKASHNRESTKKAVSKPLADNGADALLAGYSIPKERPIHSITGLLQETGYSILSFRSIHNGGSSLADISFQKGS